MGIKKIIDGKPVETEESIAEPDKELISSRDTVTTNVTTIKKILRKKIIRKIVIIDGKPIETEEVIEEPIEIMEGEEFRIEEPTEQVEEVVTSPTPKVGVVKMVERVPVKTEYDVMLKSKQDVEKSDAMPIKSESSIPSENATQKVIRHRIIKKVVIINGKPVETEITESPIKITESPIGITESPIKINQGNDTQRTENENLDNIKYDEKTIRKRIIKRIVMEDGKPIETEQIIEDPAITDNNMETVTGQQDSSHRVIRKKIIKKIVIIDGKPVEMEEVIDEPGETIKEDTAENISTNVNESDPAQNYIIQRVIRKKIIKKIVVVDGKPVETEEIIEEPADISISEKLSSVNTVTPEDSEIFQTHRIIRKKIIKKIVIIDGKPVELEEV